MRKRILLAVLSVAVFPAVLAGQQLPDTGQSTCYNSSGVTSCADTGFPRQDGSLGLAPSYTKLDAAGAELDNSAPTWSCVRDNATGLVWEAKTVDAGLQGVGHRYAWLNTNALNNGGEAGGLSETADSAWCGGTLAACTTADYAAAVNTLALCGVRDWRLPSQRELLTLVNSSSGQLVIDTAYFPTTAADVYWAATTYAPIPAFAWGVNFAYGAANAEYKDRPYRVRLVRGTPF